MRHAFRARELLFEAQPHEIPRASPRVADASPAARVADTFFVANQGADSLFRYDENGNATLFTNAFLNGPIGLALDAQGNLFVSTNSNTIEKFSPTGADLGTFANASTGLNFPMGLAFDRNGNLYAANFAGGTVEKFTPAGVASVFANVISPTGLAFDANGNLYVANFGNTIERFAPDGSALGTFASSGLNDPEGIAFDSLGNLYAANNGSSTIEKFSPNGVDLGTFVQGLAAPVGLTFDSLGNLYVVNSQTNSISKIAADGTLSNFATTAFTPAFIVAQSTPKLVNISTRGDVLTGENVLDSGFILRGAGTKTLLIRGLGPSLASSGVSGALADPVLELHGQKGALLARNDNWKTTQQTTIAATGIPPSSDVEAALVVRLAQGNYTVIESGKNGKTGVGLVEIYDLAPGFGPELANISTRGSVGVTSNAMIAGVIVAGQTSESSEVLVRLLGPSLGALGVSHPLADPVLDLFDVNGNRLAHNGNWRDTQENAIKATGLPPPNDKESAILATLPSGNYTAIASGQGGSEGVALVEVYNLH